MRASDGLGHVPVGLLIEKLGEQGRDLHDKGSEMVRKGKYVSHGFALIAAALAINGIEEALKEVLKEEHGFSVRNMKEKADETDGS